MILVQFILNGLIVVNPTSTSFYTFRYSGNGYHVNSAFDFGSEIGVPHPLFNSLFSRGVILNSSASSLQGFVRHVSSILTLFKPHPRALLFSCIVLQTLCSRSRKHTCQPFSRKQTIKAQPLKCSFQCSDSYHAITSSGSQTNYSFRNEALAENAVDCYTVLNFRPVLLTVFTNHLIYIRICAAKSRTHA